MSPGHLGNKDRWLNCGTQVEGTPPYRLGDSFKIQGYRRSVPSAPLCPVGGLSSLLRLRQIRILCCVLLKSHVDFFKFIDLLNFIVKQMFIKRNIFNCS